MGQRRCGISLQFKKPCHIKHSLMHLSLFHSPCQHLIKSGKQLCPAFHSLQSKHHTVRISLVARWTSQFVLSPQFIGATKLDILDSSVTKIFFWFQPYPQILIFCLQFRTQITFNRLSHH